MKNADDFLEKLSPNEKVNYDRILQKVVADWTANQERPKILLHSCCAPCSTYSLEYLVQYADVTILFANSNIHPKSEYQRRELVQKEFVEEFNRRTGSNVGFIASPYQPNDYMRMVGLHQLQYEPEGGARCTACFQMRLDIVAKEAVERGFDYFGTALTISPHKNSQQVNEVGLDVQKIYTVNFLPADFKKNNGYARSVQMCDEYDIYRQCYCGCVFAAKQQGIDLKAIDAEAKEFLVKKQLINKLVQD